MSVGWQRISDSSFGEVPEWEGEPEEFPFEEPKPESTLPPLLKFRRYYIDGHLYEYRGLVIHNTFEPPKLVHRDTPLDALFMDKETNKYVHFTQEDLASRNIVPVPGNYLTQSPDEWMDKQLVRAPEDSTDLWPDTLPWDEKGNEYYRNAGLQEFHDEANQLHDDYDALARDVVKTLPPEEWPQWVQNRVQMWLGFDVKPVDMTPYPKKDLADDTPGDLHLPETWSKVAQLPAEYSEEDPLDMSVVNNMVDDLHSEWWMQNQGVQRQAIANAFRAALVSPRQNLKWNSIVYQDLMHIPAEESDPAVFENVIRERKAKWDRFGQQTIDLVHEHSTDPEHIDYGSQVIEKYMPGIWKNIRNCALIGPYVEQLREAAMDDIAQGGDGTLFRQRLLDMNIPGIGPKIAAFVWLLLAPKTSRLATIDVHMMRHLGQPAESPKDYSSYLAFEQQLDDQRKQMGYDDTPLGAYQWALWDRQRTPGFHQDHTPLRPLAPTDWRNVNWAPQPARRRMPNDVAPGQQDLFNSEYRNESPTAPIQSSSRWNRRRKVTED
jgi:hypothetical protein